MDSKIKIPYSSKFFFVISLAGIIWSIYLTYKLNFIRQDYTDTENLRLNFLFLFIFSISTLALRKVITTFQSKSFNSDDSIESKISTIKKLAEIEKMGIISETENEIKLLYKSSFLGFYEIIFAVNREAFEYNVFELGGKPFDWGIRKNY